MFGNIIHKAELLTVITGIALSHMAGNAKAQSLNPPERWQADFHNVLPLYRQDTVTICFLGDVMMHSRQIEAAYQENGEYDFSGYFSHIRESIGSADISVANMEFSLGGKPYSGYPAFSAPDDIAEHMAEIGTDVFLTANNHIFDRGKAGAERTLEIYRKLGQTHGVTFTGLASDEKEHDWNQPLILNRKGIRIAFLNFTYGTNGGKREGWPVICYQDEKDKILASIEKARQRNADIIIALPHWGEEYRLAHSSEQEETAQWLADNGIDLIVGTHPHVVQGTDIMWNSIKGRYTYVAYSLGNAISNMSASNTQLGLMATAKIVRRHNGDIEVLPPELSFIWCSRPGGFDQNYTIIPVKRFAGKRNMWQAPWDYDKMTETLHRVMNATGINATDLTDTDE